MLIGKMRNNSSHPCVPYSCQQNSESMPVLLAKRKNPKLFLTQPLLCIERFHIQFSYCSVGGLISSSATLLPHLYVQYLTSGVATYLSQAVPCVSSHTWQEGCPGISRARWIPHIPSRRRSRTTKAAGSGCRVLPQLHPRTWCSRVLRVRRGPGRGCCCLPLGKLAFQLAESWDTVRQPGPDYVSGGSAQTHLIGVAC